VNRAYASMVNLVSTLDPGAAEYLLNDAPYLDGFHYSTADELPEVLNYSFTWYHSPHGRDFWDDIYQKLWAMERGEA